MKTHWWVMTVLAAGVAGCTPGYMDASKLELQGQGPAACSKACTDIGMRMTAMVLVGDTVPGCVCQPLTVAPAPPSPGAAPRPPAPSPAPAPVPEPDAHAPNTDGAGPAAAAATGGYVVIAAAAAAARQQQQQQQQQQTYKH